MKGRRYEQGNFQPGDVAAAAGYSHVAKVNKGTLIYLAGQVSSDASGKLVGEGNFEAQAEQVFRNLKLAVEAAGATMADIVKMNIYMVAEVDQADVPKMRAVRDRYVNSGEAAGQHAGVREPSGAAGLADRDRGGRGDRCMKRKRRPRRAPFCCPDLAHAAFTARCLNMLRRASSSISALNLKLVLERDRLRRRRTGRDLVDQPFDVGIFRGGLLAEDERDHAGPAPHAMSTMV